MNRKNLLTTIFVLIVLILAAVSVFMLGSVKKDLLPQISFDTKRLLVSDPISVPIETYPEYTKNILDKRVWYNEFIEVQDVAIKIDPIGLDKDLFRTSFLTIQDDENMNKGDMSMAVFRITIYNNSDVSYTPKLDDFVLCSNKDSAIQFNQPLSKSGYDNWKYVSSSFKFDSIDAKSYREGYIFFPVPDSIGNDFIFKGYLQNIPIEIK